MQRATLDLAGDLNREHLAETGDQEIASRIASSELAWRMQSAAPELSDLSNEPKHIREMYGLDDPATRRFATNCILARRLVERGVRFVLMMDASWDQHTFLNRDLKKNCDRTDRPAAALIRDLKQRGCWIQRWWCGAESSDARRSWRSATARTRKASDGIIIRTPIRCGWPEAASGAGR